MPRRKGYGIPPTKRIKIENESENDENEPDKVQRETNENEKPDQPPSIPLEANANTFNNVSADSNKYLHKKFKKMAAILSDDCSNPLADAAAENRSSSGITINNANSNSYSATVPSSAENASTIVATAARKSSLPECTRNDVITSAVGTRTEENRTPPSRNNQFTDNHSNDGYGLAVRSKSATSVCAAAAFPNLYCTSENTAAAATVAATTACNTFTSVALTAAPPPLPPVIVTEDDGTIPAIVGRHACPYCKLVCNKPSVLQKHIRAHTNERPYPCLPCGFAFKTRSNLYKHCRSRSHSLKLEEVGGDNGMSVRFYAEEEITPEEEEENAQAYGMGGRDESGSDEKSEGVQKRSIYKPKFHKAAIYIQNSNAATTVSSRSESTTASTMNKLGLQIKLPATSTSGQHVSSAPSTPSPFTSGSSPSPEFLQRHISKLISENQAIVETTDPFWSKKFYHRKEGSPSSSPLSTSSSSSTGVESYKKLTAKQEQVEDKLPVESKLAHALLQPRGVRANSSAVENAPEDMQPLNLTIRKDTRRSKSGRDTFYTNEGIDSGTYKTAEHVTTTNGFKFTANGVLAGGYLKQDAHQSGNYKQLSVITPLHLESKLRNVIVEQKCATSLKSLEELSNAPIKTNHFVYNAALADNAGKMPLKYEPKDEMKGSLIVTRTEEQRATTIKSTGIAQISRVVEPMYKQKSSAEMYASGKSNSGSAKMSQFMMPLVQGAPSLATIQAVPTILAVTASNADIRLSPSTGGYKGPVPAAVLQKPKPNHVNGGVVTILHGGKVIPYVPGMPGPQSLNSVYLHADDAEKKNNEAVKRKADDAFTTVNGMYRNHKLEGDVMGSMQTVAQSMHGVVVKEEVYSEEDRDSSSMNAKFIRPSSLPLKPGTFVPKKMQPGTSSVLPLISPETPRPNKSYGQLYIGGNAYTYLGLKCSTRSTFCTLHKSQPTYVPLSPEHNKVSMYSNWKVRSEVDPYLRDVPATKAMSCYDSRQRYSPYTIVHGKTKDAVTHSSYWLNRSKIQTEGSEMKSNSDGEENKENNISQQNEMSVKLEDTLKTSKICMGGIESSDNYTYIRGRGRGKYVCLECGIRCRKPSMLKKHIRTHTDVRPYICKHCVFGFKTKGNLTKHMKSKAHYKKCIEMGIVPVPTIVDDSYVDEEVLSKQAQQLEEGQDIEETEEEDDDEDEDDDDDNDDDYHSEDKDAEDPKCQLEREVAKSLLSLSKMSHQTVSEQYANAGLVPLNARPNTYPYDFLATPHMSSKAETPTLTLISEQKEREKVTKNTGLTRDVHPTSVQANQLVKPKSETQIERYYFGSTNEKEPGPRACSPFTPRVDVSSSPDGHDHKDVVALKSPFMERPKPELPDRCSGDSDTKENFVLTPVETEKPECSTSVIISIGSPNSTLTNPSKRLKTEFIAPCNGPLPKYASYLEDGRSKCVVCNKVFSKPSQLKLHVNIHYFEQPFRCEPCGVSFRTKGHLHKHLGSNSHLNKVSMNSATGGQTSTNNPRPFKCDDCSIGFRIHGHLAKHLRSKMHILKLECVGKLPFGTYAEMERCGFNMNDIDTSDCENSLESLQKIAKGSGMYINSADAVNKIVSENSSF